MTERCVSRWVSHKAAPGMPGLPDSPEVAPEVWSDIWEVVESDGRRVLRHSQRYFGEEVVISERELAADSAVTVPPAVSVAEPVQERHRGDGADEGRSG